MIRSSINRTIRQSTYVIELIKDYVSERKVYIHFRSTNIDGLKTSFSIYLKGNNADIIELHNLLKTMDKYDKVEIKFIKSLCGL